MKCPICNAPTFVRESREGRRKRECFNTHRFTTQEVIVSTPKPKPEESKK